MSAEVSFDKDREWHVVPSRSSKPPTHNGSSVTELNMTKRHHKRPQWKDHSHSSDSKQRSTPLGRGVRNENSDALRVVSKPPVVRLLRRLTQKDDVASHQQHDTSVPITSTEGTKETTDHGDDLKQKIGVPIIRSSPRISFSTRTQRREPDKQTGVTSQSRIGDSETENDQGVSTIQHRAGDAHTHLAREDELGSSQCVSGPPCVRTGQSELKASGQQRGGLLMLPKKETDVCKESLPPPAFDLSSDDMWPSIAGVTTAGSGSGQGAWLSSDGSSPGKGWSSIVKTVPSSVKREVSPHNSERSGEEEETPVISGEIKNRRRRKKRKSGESVTQQSPQEKKLNSPVLLDLSQYMEQSPTRPVLNRKDTKKAAVSSGNVLDATAPVMRRGKEREEPKAKKPTQLRKIIIKEKAVKRQLREQGQIIPPDLDVTKKENESERSQQSVGGDKVDPAPLTTPTHQPAQSDKVDRAPLTTPTHQPAQSMGGDKVDRAPLTTPTHQPAQSVGGDKVDRAPLTTPTHQPAQRIHSRKFREYCSHMVTDEINSVVELLLQDLVRFQDRQHQRDPVRAKSKRRYVCGLREVHKHLEVGKLKCVIIPPNLDHIQSTGGIDERVSTILSLCHERGVKVVYAMSRRRLATVLKKKFKMGCVGIFSYDGAEKHYKNLMKLVEEATERYRQVALFQAGAGSKEADISTTQVPQTESDNSEAGASSLEDDENSVPDPGNGKIPTGAHIMDTQWRIFFKRTDQTDDITGSNSPTNQRAGNSSDVNHLNQNAEKRGDVTSHHLTNQDSDTDHLTNQNAENVGDVTSQRKKEEFHWNVNATEFKPLSFVSL